MNIAIMCNVGCHNTLTTRSELINSLVEEGHKIFVFGVEEHNEDCQNNNVSFVTIDAFRNNTNPLKELGSLANIRQNVKKNKIDAAIIYGVKNHSAMAIGSYLAGCKNILCIVNGSGNLFRLSGVKGKVVKLMAFPMLRLAYRVSQNICFQNMDDKMKFVKNKLVKDNNKLFVTCGSGVNLDCFTHKPLSTDNRFLFLARITPTKGIHEYIDAARIVKKKYPDTAFDVVGPIDLAVENGVDDLLQKAVEENIINYHGETTDVPAWMEKCRFFVYPSYYPEGVPRCAIQAIATGRPIITCNTPGCKETVVDGVNGFEVESQNIGILAEKMIWMLEHRAEVEKMAVESRQYAETKFDVNKINTVLCNRLFS